MISLAINLPPTPAVQAAPAAVAPAGTVPAVPSAAAPGLVPDGAAAPAPQDTGAALPFAQLLDQLADAGSTDELAQPGAAHGDATSTNAQAPVDDAGTDADTAQPLQPMLLAAMVPPLMPAAFAAAAGMAATPAAASAGLGAATATGDAKAATGQRAGAAPQQAPAAQALAAIDSGAPDTAASQAAPAAAALPPAQAPAIQLAAAPQRPVADSASAAPAAAPAASPASPAAPALAATDGATDRAARADAPVARDSAAGMVSTLAAPAPAAPQRGSDSVTLSGPPTAWRQSLHEALGSRLDLQLGNRMEQAVIRLEPPQLGRIEIAIRHSEGSLQVTLSATHNEVLRQLQGVSDNLRNDLAQRQFTDVAVTVAPAPRNAAANPFGGDAQGRGRQPGQEQQEQAPGLALFDADAGASAFSLTGRE